MPNQHSFTHTPNTHFTERTQQFLQFLGLREVCSYSLPPNGKYGGLFALGCALILLFLSHPKESQGSCWKNKWTARKKKIQILFNQCYENLLSHWFFSPERKMYQKEKNR